MSAALLLASRTTDSVVRAGQDCPAVGYGRDAKFCSGAPLAKADPLGDRPPREAH
ncbi:MAG TPA: hypothetical protein VHE30_06760 [Polyangiaceae bacterium]|nr:hypothetical protein [Polyangiaceae bacterium]